MNPVAVLARVVAALVVAFTVLGIVQLCLGLRDARISQETRESLRKLSALTIRNFPERNLDSPDLFWKSIGREGKPMMDEWGTEYQISSRKDADQNLYFWSSAGPDRRFGSRDDIVVPVPYPSGPLTSPDLVPGESPVPVPMSHDAK